MLKKYLGRIPLGSARKAVLLEGVKYFSLSLLLALITFPNFDPGFSTGIDGSLPWVFNHLFNGNQLLGKDIIFPHGPLAFLLYPIPLGMNLVIAAIFYSLLKLLLSFNFLYLFRLKDPSNWLMPAIILLILLHLLNIQLLLLAVVASFFLLYFTTQKQYWIYPALVLTAIGIYIKSYVGILSLTLCFSFIVVDFFNNCNFKRSLLFTGLLLCSYLALWAVLFGNFTGIFNYFYGIFELASNNSSATSYYIVNNWWYLTTAIVLFLVIPFVHRDKKIVIFYGMFSLVAFAAWKHGMARQDIYHGRGLFVFLCLLFSLLLSYIDKYKFTTLAISMLILCFFYLNLKNVVQYEELRVNVMRVNAFADFVFDYEQYKQHSIERSAANIRKNHLDSTTLQIIGNKTVDVYPWDYSFIPANNLNWQPRRVIQSYASYTSWLDKQNSDHFESENAPDFLIWEVDKVSDDINGGKMESADNRYLPNDEPQAIYSILKNYRLIRKTGKILLFEKQNTPILKKGEEVESLETTWNEWIDVPETADGILRAKLMFNNNLLGKLKSFLYKNEEFFIYYLLENEDIIKYKIIPENAADGVWVSPLILNPSVNYLEPNVKKIQLRCSNKKLVNNKLLVEWEYIGLNPSKEDTSAVQPVGFNQPDQHLRKANLFGQYLPDTGKSFTISKHIIIDESNPASSRFKPGQRYKADFFSSPHACKIPPHHYSSSFTLDLDSLLLGKKWQQININANVWAKANASNSAVMVISIDNQGENLYWEAAMLKDFVIDEDEWDYGFIRKNILKTENICTKGSALSIYVWNNDEHSLLIDDFKVKIEGR